MINKVREFIVKHYLVCTYLVFALALVLTVMFKKDLQFLLHMLAALVVIILFAALGVLLYIFVRALINDRMFDKGSLRNSGLVALLLAILYPVFLWAVGIEDIDKVYMFAPLASWPAILSIFILNCYTRFTKKK